MKIAFPFSSENPRFWSVENLINFWKKGFKQTSKMIKLDRAGPQGLFLISVN